MYSCLKNCKEKNRQKAEERERQLQARKQALLAMSEKELLVELLLEMERIGDRLDDIENKIVLYGN